ncbi:MAG: hypothetical protein CVV03_02240 [Firmicutes bacterium HGW-Firmicutes-8]|nr:MAG: hypothetical protein CVV03_02240 [Firmicutes bacterium HGW-Firmicutes-8]
MYLQIKKVVGSTVAMLSVSGMLLTGPFSMSPVTASVSSGQLQTYTAHGQTHGGKHGCKMLDTVSQLTGLTPDQIKIQRKAGKSLAQIAQSKGVSEEKLIAAIMEPIKAKFQKRVSEGKITPEKAKEILAKIEQKVKTRVNNTKPPQEHRIKG